MATESRIEVCAHHWVIDSPNGPTSSGVCKLCGATQDFVNSIGSVGWEKVTSYGRSLNHMSAPPSAKALHDD